MFVCMDTGNANVLFANCMGVKCQLLLFLGLMAECYISSEPKAELFEGENLFKLFKVITAA